MIRIGSAHLPTASMPVARSRRASSRSSTLGASGVRSMAVIARDLPRVHGGAEHVGGAAAERDIVGRGAERLVARIGRVDGDSAMDAARPRRHDDDAVDRKTLSNTEWVTKTTVKRSSCQSSSRSLLSRKRVISSSAAKGSSISRIFGLVTRPRAIETRIFMPPESSRGTASSKPSRRTRASISRTAGAALVRETPRRRSGSQTLSKTLAQGSSVGSWKTKPMLDCAENPAPRQSIVPVVGDSRPAISRSAVDLPQPDGPSSDRNSPCLIVRSTSRSATTPLENVLPTPRSVSSGAAAQAAGIESPVRRHPRTLVLSRRRQSADGAA